MHLKQWLHLFDFSPLCTNALCIRNLTFLHCAAFETVGSWPQLPPLVSSQMNLFSRRAAKTQPSAHYSAKHIDVTLFSAKTQPSALEAKTQPSAH